jgi:hypothetical protein
VGPKRFAAGSGARTVDSGTVPHQADLAAPFGAQVTRRRPLSLARPPIVTPDPLNHGADRPVEGCLMSTRSEVFVRPRSRSDHAVSPSVAAAPNEQIVEQVRTLLAELRFGSVTLIVQDGQVVQIETTRKVRLATPGAAVGALR